MSEQPLQAIELGAAHPGEPPARHELEPVVEDPSLVGIEGRLAPEADGARGRAEAAVEGPAHWLSPVVGPFGRGPALMCASMSRSRRSCSWSRALLINMPLERTVVDDQGPPLERLEHVDRHAQQVDHEHGPRGVVVDLRQPRPRPERVQAGAVLVRGLVHRPAPVFCDPDPRAAGPSAATGIVSMSKPSAPGPSAAIAARARPASAMNSTLMSRDRGGRFPAPAALSGDGCPAGSDAGTPDRPGAKHRRRRPAAWRR